jgi:hypothetical protein
MTLLLKRLAVQIAILCAAMYAYHTCLERTVSQGVRANFRHSKRVILERTVIQGVGPNFRTSKRAIRKVAIVPRGINENCTFFCHKIREYSANDLEAHRGFIQLIDSDAIAANPEEEDLAAGPICVCGINIEIPEEDVAVVYPMPNPTVAPVEREEEANEHFRSFVDFVIRWYAGPDILVCA